jgi:2-polyprenyl-3-methyl-5-hydroxy-6-metoxy-1,4-benzoquinol methylase
VTVLLLKRSQWDPTIVTKLRYIKTQNKWTYESESSFTAQPCCNYVPGKRVVDVACGTDQLWWLGGASFVLGTDLSQAMVDLVEHNWRKQFLGTKTSGMILLSNV